MTHLLKQSLERTISHILSLSVKDYHKVKVLNSKGKKDRSDSGHIRAGATSRTESGTEQRAAPSLTPRHTENPAENQS